MKLVLYLATLNHAPRQHQFAVAAAVKLVYRAREKEMEREREREREREVEIVRSEGILMALPRAMPLLNCAAAAKQKLDICFIPLFGPDSASILRCIFLLEVTRPCRPHG
jgi:hypothetical protein